jgi:hypothetical protein
MNRSKHTGRACPLLTRTGLVAAFLATAGVVAVEQSVHADGLVRCWGNNDNGQCNTPADLGPCSSVAGGGYHTIALRIDGSVQCWGSNQYGQCFTPADLGSCSSVAAGSYHTMALRIDGSVRCWGWNQNEQCNTPAELGSCISIAAGAQHSIALRVDGTVRCWGRNDYGQCDTPSDLGTCRAIGGGWGHTVALRTDGGVRCWGNNDYGQCYIPADLGLCRSITAAYGTTIAIRADGTVRCWGVNDDGQCEVPSDLGSCSGIALGARHSMALPIDGLARCWGAGTTNTGEWPNWGQSIVPAGVETCVSVVAGAFHSIALISLDCDGNGIADATEIAGHDCNNDSILDACNARYDTLEDCNNNRLGDTCEKELTLALHSSQLAPIGFNTNQIWTVQAATRAQSPVTLRIHGHGDFGGLQEYVRVKVGVGFDEHALQNTTDCENGSGTPSISTFTLTPEQFNAAIGADGALRVVMQPSIAVDPAGCNGGTWIEASLDYIGALPADCNANGLLDSCEIAAGYSPDSNQNGVVDICESLLLECPTDFNQSGSTDGADLGILLAAWGVTGQPGVDLNHDGIINGADLGALLANWGVCAN